MTFRIILLHILILVNPFLVLAAMRNDIYNIDRVDKLAERKCIKLGKAKFLFSNYPYYTDPYVDNRYGARKVIYVWNKNHMAVFPFVLNIIAYAMFLIEIIFAIMYFLSEMTVSQLIHELIVCLVYAFLEIAYRIIFLIRKFFDNRKIKREMQRRHEEYLSKQEKNNTDNPPPEDKP